MRLRGVELRLFARLATKEIVIVGVKRYSRCELNRPATERLREAKLGLQRPAIAPDVHEPGVIVLAERDANSDARAEDEILPVLGELRRRESGRADEVHREAKRRIAETIDVTRVRHTEDLAFRAERDVGDDQLEFRGLAEHIQDCGASEHTNVGCNANVLDWQRRIGQELARRVSITDDDKMKADRRVSVGTRFEILRGERGAKHDERCAGHRSKKVHQVRRSHRREDWTISYTFDPKSVERILRIYQQRMLLGDDREFR